MAKTKEGIIQTEILNSLYRHYPDAIILRYNNTPTYDPRTKKFRSQHGKFIPYGVSDVFFFYRGKAVAIEIKSEEKYFYIERNWDKLSRGDFLKPKERGKGLTERERFYHQIKFIDDLKCTGNFGFFTHSAEHCLTQLKIYYGGGNVSKEHINQMSLLPLCMD